MLMPLFSISQTVYPYQSVIKGDTVAVLTIGQVRYINIWFSKFDECREMNDSLHNLIEAFSEKSAEYEKGISMLIDDNATIEQQYQNEKSINLAQKELTKSAKKKGNFKLLLGVGIGALGVAIFK